VVLPDSHGVSRAPCYLGENLGRLAPFAYRAITFCGESFQTSSARAELCNSPTGSQPCHSPSLNPAAATPASFDTTAVWAHPRSLATTRGIAVAFFSSLLRCFSSPAYPRLRYIFTQRLRGITRVELPHSGTSGSQLASSSPEHYRCWLRPSSAPDAKAFILSLAVLVHYRSSAVFSLSAWTHRIHTGFHVSRATWDASRAPLDFAYRPVTFFGAVFHRLPLSIGVPHRGPATPTHKCVGLGCSPFARHY